MNKLIVLAALLGMTLEAQDVLTFHNNNARTGADLHETQLTPKSVNSSTFGKVFTVKVDGKVDAQPLYVSDLPVKGATRNVVFAATEHDSVYAFDAASGEVLWEKSVLGAGERPSDPRNCSQVIPEIGITSTPVIDKRAGDHGTIYLVAMSKDSTGKYHQRIHALDLVSGSEEFGGPVEIAASYPGTGKEINSDGKVIFDPKQHEDRAGLLMVNGVVYTSWSSHCDIDPYTGWVIGYDSNTLKQTGVFNFAANGSRASIWNSGAAPAADDEGNMYFSVANGDFDAARGNYGNAVVKLNKSLQVADYWTMFNTVEESNKDQDLGSGGLMLLPDLRDSEGSERQLLVAAGKDKNIYVLNRNNMGKFDSKDNGTIYQELLNALGGREFAQMAWFHDHVYVGAVNDVLKAFAVKNARLAPMPSSSSSNKFAYPGTNPVISANGTNDGIVWAYDNGARKHGQAVLRAYDADNLATEYYDSNQAANGRDHFGEGNKYISPTVANGRVYVGTPNSVVAFGLLK